MLKTLHIENYALIRETDISFAGGFVVITGETGAGKSILLGALGLLLGQRADTQVLSDKERKCVVEATFDIADLGLEPLFARYDADYDDVLILRREILPSAKSRAFVNDSPANLQFLKELGPHILDIHSQYQTLTLTESTFQTQLLDTLADHSPLSQYQTQYREYASLKHELEQLTAQESENKKAYDYNMFLFNELKAANLAEDEQQELEDEARLLEHAETIKEALGNVVALCDGNEGDGVVSRLSSSRGYLSHVASFHEGIESLYQRLDSCLIEVQDILSEAADLDDKIQYSPERQEEVNSRLDLIYRLQKKHNVGTIAELLEIERNLDSQLQEADSLDDRIRDLMERVDKVFSQMQQTADRLTSSRRKAGPPKPAAHHYLRRDRQRCVGRHIGGRGRHHAPHVGAHAGDSHLPPPPDSRQGRAALQGGKGRGRPLDRFPHTPTHTRRACHRDSRHALLQSPHCSCPPDCPRTDKRKRMHLNDIINTHF